MPGRTVKFRLPRTLELKNWYPHLFASGDSYRIPTWYGFMLNSRVNELADIYSPGEDCFLPESADIYVEYGQALLYIFPWSYSVVFRGNQRVVLETDCFARRQHTTKFHVG